MEDVGSFESVNELDCVAVVAFDISFPRISAISSSCPFSIHVWYFFTRLGFKRFSGT